MQFDSLGQGQELELELCRLYAKKSCKKCYGRGYLIYDTPTQFFKYETRDKEIISDEKTPIDELADCVNKQIDVVDIKNGTITTTTKANTTEVKRTPLPKHWADYCSCTKKGMVKAAQ